MALKTVEEYVWRFNTELFEQREIQNKINECVRMIYLTNILHKNSIHIFLVF